MANMVSTLTREQVRQVDALAMEALHIPGIVLMENAGANATRCILDRIKLAGASRALIFCGTGNNGGDGFVIARHLANEGMNVRLFLCGDRQKLSPDAAVNHRIASAMNLPIQAIRDQAEVSAALREIAPQDAVIDALLGTGFSGTVREPMAALIDGINHADAALRVAVDVPSGLDCNTGNPSNATFRADFTVTFVARKTGFAMAQAKSCLGETVVCGIGSPPALIERVLLSTDGGMADQLPEEFSS
jgi:NAD(P)H-hydrate epimerase